MTETTLTQTRPEMVDEDYCPCARLTSPMTREHHDWLLGFEARGLVGAMELLTHAYYTDEGGSDVGTLFWADLKQFAGLHSWEQPAAVYQFVRLIDNEIRARNGRYTAQAGLESVITIATTALEQIKR